MHHSKVYFKSISEGTFHPGNLHRTQSGKEAYGAFQLDANRTQGKNYCKYILQNTARLSLKQADASSIACTAKI